MALAAAKIATITELRARLDAPRFGGAPRVVPGRLSAGSPELDAWLGGWPMPGIAEVSGPVGSGRLSLVLPALAALGKQGQPVVIVDPEQQFYAPGSGIPFDAQVIVRPPPDQAGWVTEQVARSGAVAACLLLDPPRLGRVGLRIARACEVGNMAIFVVGTEAEQEIPAALRLSVEGWSGASVRVTCTRSRDGRVVGRGREVGVG
jgi:hypothetical protein